MREVTVTVNFKDGLHARPAVKFVKLVAPSKSGVTLIKDGEEYDTKSISSLLSACVTYGQSITIRAEGEDEDATLDRIIQYFETESTYV